MESTTFSCRIWNIPSLFEMREKEFDPAKTFIETQERISPDKESLTAPEIVWVPWPKLKAVQQKEQMDISTDFMQ